MGESSGSSMLEMGQRICKTCRASFDNSRRSSSLHPIISDDLAEGSRPENVAESFRQLSISPERRENIVPPLNEDSSSDDSDTTSDPSESSSSGRAERDSGTGHVEPSDNPSDDSSEGSSNGPPDDSSDESQDDSYDGDDNRSFARVSRSSHGFCVYGCRNSPLRVIPDAYRTRILQDHNVFIPQGARWCQSHSVLDDWEDIPTLDRSLTPAEYELSLQLLKGAVRDGVTFFDFSRLREMKDSLVLLWTGLNKSQIVELYPFVSLLKDYENSLGIFLVRLSRGLTYEEIASLFNLSRATVARRISQVGRELQNRFVPAYLGTTAFSREQLLANSTRIAQGLMANQSAQELILIWDGTYLFQEKSSNFRYQRDSYSMQKSRNLFKPMVCVTPNGLIVDAMGPFSASDNDASILNHILETNAEMHSLIQPSDIFVLDRGFWDSVRLLEMQGFSVFIPSLSTGNSQPSALEANHSRLVTKVRYVVETINGHFKTKYRLFTNILRNQSLAKAFSFFRIAASLMNKFGQRVSSDRGYEQLIIDSFGDRLSLVNLLQSVVLTEGLRDRRSNKFEYHELMHVPFPRLEPFDLIKIALGTYQPRLAASYYFDSLKTGVFRVALLRNEHMPNFRNYSIRVRNPVLVGGEIHSRFSSTRVNRAFILLDRARAEDSQIIGYYCPCKAGSRTAGCCSHILATIWCLGWMRNHGSEREPAQILDDFASRLRNRPN